MKSIILFILFVGINFVNASNESWKKDCRSKEYLSEVARYLYRWHMTPQQIKFSAADNVFEFWVRKLDCKLDDGDQSIYQEIILPKVGMRVVVKKTDYQISELELVVKSEGYWITSYNNINIAHFSGKKENYKVVDFDYNKLKKHLLETSHFVSFPSMDLLYKIKKAASH